MLSATERREEILEILSDRRSETVAGLAVQFSVSERTIRRDLAMLSRFSPIFTVQGRGGGICAVDGWYVGRRYLRASQEQLLREILPTLPAEKQTIMESILLAFVKPAVR